MNEKAYMLGGIFVDYPNKVEKNKLEKSIGINLIITFSGQSQMEFSSVKLSLQLLDACALAVELLLFFQYFFDTAKNKSAQSFLLRKMHTRN